MAIFMVGKGQSGRAVQALLERGQLVRLMQCCLEDVMRA